MNVDLMTKGILKLPTITIVEFSSHNEIKTMILTMLVIN